MRKHFRKHPWTLGFIILLVLMFATIVLAQKWAQVVLDPGVELLNGVWVTATPNTSSPLNPSLKIYAVGDNGTIIYSENGSTWDAQTSETIYDLNAVWGRSAIDIFTVGDTGTILHSTDGATWDLQPSGTGEDLNAVWGSSSTNVYAVGNQEIILSYDGDGTWSPLHSGGAYNLRGVWGSSANDIFAVGDHGLIFHYNGTTLSPQYVGDDDLNAVWGTSSDNVYAVGESGTILHYNGTTWAAVQSVSTLYDFYGIWGTSPCNIYVAGKSNGNAIAYHFDGSTWSLQDIGGTIPYPLTAVHGASIRDIYAVGGTVGTGIVMKFNPEASTAPIVCSSQPGLYDSNIPLTTTVSATFNAVMDPATILEPGNFTLVYYENQEAHQVEGTLSFSNNSSTLTFTPTSPFTDTKVQTYHATLKAPDAQHGITGVKDSLGVPLATDYTWSFTPGSDNWDSDSGGGCFIEVSQTGR